MNPDLEEQLRQALRPVEPPADFSARVLARVAEETVPAAPHLPWRRQRRRLWVPVALAASLAAALTLRIEWQQRRELQGLQARQQLIEALRVTSQKLDLAYRIVNTPPAPGSDDSSGA
jgi:hypothetical protein